jgi:hypothetical protein
MGPADPNTPRNPGVDDGPLSEQARELRDHPIPEWDVDKEYLGPDPNLEVGD